MDSNFGSIHLPASSYRYSMKLFIVVCMFAALQCVGQTPRTEFISFDGSKYFLANERSTAKQSLKEYVPAHENVAEWHMLISIGTSKEKSTATEYAGRYLEGVRHAAQISGLKYADKSDRVCVLDFITVSRDHKAYEQNIIKVTQTDDKGEVNLVRWANKLSVEMIKSPGFGTESNRLERLMSQTEFHAEGETTPPVAMGDVDAANLAAEMSEGPFLIETSRDPQTRNDDIALVPVRITSAVYKNVVWGKKMTVKPRPKFQGLDPFPAELRQRGISGTARVAYVVEPSGAVSDIRVLDASDERFARAGAGTVQKWRYVPFEAPAQLRALFVVKIKFDFADPLRTNG